MKPLAASTPSGDEQTEEGGAPAVAPRANRRVVEIIGYIIRPNKTIVDVKVVNLSYDGCLITTLVPLVPGEKVKLSALSRGAVSATVRWYKGRKAGLLFQSESVSRQRWPRKAERLQVRAETSLRRRGRLSYRVQTFDVSRFGCSCEFIEWPVMYERVWVKFDGLESIESVVVWVEVTRIGVMFLNPLHPAVFDLLLAKLKPESAGEPLP